MGFWSNLFGPRENVFETSLTTPTTPEVGWPFDPTDAARRVLPDPWEPFMGGLQVADPGVPLESLTAEDVETMWRAHSSLRTVTGFIARNVATIPYKVYDRRSDTDRRRVTDHALARAVSHPAARPGRFRFWEQIVTDGLLYDRWAIMVTPNEVGEFDLTRLPAARLNVRTDILGRVYEVRFLSGIGATGADKSGWVSLPLDQLIVDHGYGPSSAGLSPVTTLANTLREEAEAIRWRRQVWHNGARAPQYISRPQGATWSAEARARFVQTLHDQYFGPNAPRAGGAPLFEDGMELKAAGSAFSPKDTTDLEGRRLTREEVAAAFHIAPELVGTRQGTYSNMREYRSALYRDYLGPYIIAIEDALNSQLVPMIAADTDLYVEADLDTKLRGSFEEQAQIMSTATGGPWVTRNEARAKQNLPPIDGADELVVPLNVVTGGQASPRDSGSQNLRARTPGPQVKARAPKGTEKEVEELFTDFFGRQGRSVLAALGAGKSDWWDTDRWNRELGDDLLEAGTKVSSLAATAALADAGLDPASYDVGRTKAFLSSVAERIASQVNDTTHAQLSAALEQAEDDDDLTPSSAAAHVFEVAVSARAVQAATTVATTVSAFGTHEAGRQSGAATKTWVVTSGNPRAAHAAMNGETVPISENFSNGMPWPGSVEGDVDDVAGCQCELVINY